MCGVVATLGAAAAGAARLLAGVAHRGPDASRLATDGPCTLGAARLRMVGDARSDQPLRGPRGVLAAMNGEAFNHADFAPTADGGSDLSALLVALERDGAAALDRVRGPFAVAWWDPAASELVLARDPWGVRPLYVSADARGVAAASEPWPLFEASGAAARLDEAALAHLLAFQFPPPDRTLLRGVRPLAPGAVRRFRATAAGIVEAAAGRTAYAGPSEADLAAALRSAARLQGPATRRTAIFLSGGLDSSAVLGLLREAGCAPDLAFVGWFPEAGAGLDERPHARAVAAACRVPLVEVPIRAVDALEALPGVLRALGGPTAGPGSLSAAVLARAARDHGVDVVFTGQGGDELYGGYERHRLLAALDRGEPLAPASGYEPLAAALAAAPDPLRAALVRGDALRALLEPAAVVAMDAAVERALPPAGPALVERALAFERAVLLPGLLAVDDRTLAARGIEGRVPLLDPAAARLAASTPWTETFPAGSPRRRLAGLAGAALPEPAARRRDKMGFPMPLGAWFRGPWRDAAYDLLAGDALTAFGFRRGAARAAFAAGALDPRTAWFLIALARFESLAAELRARPSASARGARTSRAAAV
ncbi:MAG TPA: asparagine synthase-related protein [Planctomycetota bacterium]|nr:asparagine synthase-related protein [Planctomycetota bacterium]